MIKTYSSKILAYAKKHPDCFFAVCGLVVIIHALLAGYEETIQLGVALGTLGLGLFAFYEMRQNRRARELEIFEKYSTDYIIKKNDVLELLNSLPAPKKKSPTSRTVGMAPANHETKKFITIFSFIKLCEKEWFLYQKNWISKDLWAVWSKGMKKIIKELDNHPSTKEFLMFSNYSTSKNLTQFEEECRRRQLNETFVSWFTSHAKCNQENKNA